MDELLKTIADLSAEEKERVAQVCGPPPNAQPAAAAAAHAGHHTQARVSQFSGGTNKSDVSFQQRRFEV